jgi:hypothetical protein
MPEEQRARHVSNIYHHAQSWITYLIRTFDSTDVFLLEEKERVFPNNSSSIYLSVWRLLALISKISLISIKRSFSGK